MQMSNLQQRLWVGSIVTLVAFLVVSLSHRTFFGPLFVLSVALIALVALQEFFSMAAKKGAKPMLRFAQIFSVAYLLSLAAGAYFGSVTSLPLMLLILTLFTPFFYCLKKKEASILSLSVTFFGLVYITVPLGMLVQINYFFSKENSFYGLLWLFYLILVTKLNDTAAYFVGSRFGKTPFMSKISPKKSFEGAIAGLCGSLLASLGFYIFSPLPISLMQSILLGLVLGVMAMVGDLAESMLKRDAGVKDSNNLPGLGGVLDMVDSLLFTAPVLYLFIVSTQHS